jgi:hypothetical protein
MTATGSTTDVLLAVLIILLLVTIVGCAMWPPHHHRFTTVITEHWNYKGHHYKLLQCVCGKKRELFLPLEDSHDQAL